MLACSASAQDLRLCEMKEVQDEYSPRGVIEACFDNASVSPQFSPPRSQVDSSNSRVQSNWSKLVISWKRKSVKRLSSVSQLLLREVPKGKCTDTKEYQTLRDLLDCKSCIVNFSLGELMHATKNFSKDNLVGIGGFAEVYRGCLPDGKLVAVKKLTKGTTDEMTAGFLSELGILAHLSHPNVAKLLGCGIEGGMHMIFELAPLGSLGSVLHDSGIALDWSKRYKIALGTADGLLYLHEACQKRIIHRDIKAANILLTRNFEPKICDFGLAKWLPAEWTHHNVSKFEGTFGYFAPEYFMHGVVDERTDVFAFGVLLLELITGRRALDHLQQSLVTWATPLLNNNDIQELVDPSLGDNFNRKEMDCLVLAASSCTERSPILRPLMSEVVLLLRGDHCAEKQRRRQSIKRSYSEQFIESNNHLTYLNHLKEIALAQ